jgi:pyruvate kinase
MDGDNQKINCSYKELPNSVNVGSPIFIDDGGLVCEVIEVQDEAVIVLCKNAYRLKEKKVIHLPGASIEIPTLTEQDELDLVEFGIKKNCDIVCASFVRKASDIEYVRGFVK